MKKIILLLCLVGLVSGIAYGGESGHYVNGIEGIKAATMPPPGFYYRMYNAFYKTTKLIDQNGNKSNGGFDLSVYAMANRFLWVSDLKLLGANYAADVIIPLINTDIEIGGNDKNKFGLGDICIEPLALSWHGSRYDASFALGFYMPTGEYDNTDPSSPGKDFWTFMMTLGSTWYFDVEKTWSASILARYETHSDKRDTDVKPGDDFHFEWGIGKTFAKIFDVGVAGYCNWQVSEDTGINARPDKDVLYKSFAAGPEVSVFLPPPTGLILSLRSLWEFGAKDTTEGSITTLTLTKFF